MKGSTKTSSIDQVPPCPATVNWTCMVAVPVPSLPNSQESEQVAVSELRADEPAAVALGGDCSEEEGRLGACRVPDDDRDIQLAVVAVRSGVVTVFAAKRRRGSSRVMQNEPLVAEPVSFSDCLSPAEFKE